MSVDVRTRVDSEQQPVEAGVFFRETLPPLLDQHRDHIVPGASELPIESFCIETDGDPWTLEWLGDRVLGLIVADQLFRSFPDEEEGPLAPSARGRHLSRAAPGRRRASQEYRRRRR